MSTGKFTCYNCKSEVEKKLGDGFGCPCCGYCGPAPVVQPLPSYPWWEPIYPGFPSPFEIPTTAPFPYTIIYTTNTSSTSNTLKIKEN